MRTITLSFAAQMTSEASKYQIFLTPEYAQYASTQRFPIRLVREIPSDIQKQIGNILSDKQ
jgi:hypothetical protein